jgi:hypothetical protein
MIRTICGAADGGHSLRVGAGLAGQRTNHGRKASEKRVKEKRAVSAVMVLAVSSRTSGSGGRRRAADRRCCTEAERDRRP